MIELYGYQSDAIKRMHNGCILCGKVGSGKSRTAIAYFYICNGGDLNAKVPKMKDPKDLYIITTAKKRDTLEWEQEMAPFLLSTDQSNSHKNKVVIDSWNNIHKYDEIQNAFFIFDEQRVIGKGAWVKSFLKITKLNNWILLSGTPGDTWTDYIPVFIANGFYRNRTEFNREHVVFSRFSKFPKVDRYLNTGRLIRLRNNVLVNMDYTQKTMSHHVYIYTEFNRAMYKDLIKNRWNYEKNEPIQNASELCYELRKVCNADICRLIELEKLALEKSRIIVFYNYDYELELLKTADIPGCEIAEWNGHKHQPIPAGDRWLYLVQYNAGAEGWNCIRTDTIVFFSPNYSYKIMVQAAGRIDRVNTPYTDLYFYHLQTRSGIDLAIAKALSQKKKFNESTFKFC